MDELEQSLKYVPTYQVIEKSRKEEKKIAKEKLAVANNKIKAEKEQKDAVLAQAEALANALLNKGVDIKTIAKIIEITPKKVEGILVKIK